MFVTMTLLEKARQGRRAALTALTMARLDQDDANVVSIFDESFDAKFEEIEASSGTVVAFPNRATTPRPALMAA